MKIPASILSIFIAFWSSAIMAQDPQIQADVTQGCDTVRVNFSFTTSIGSITSIEWRFGDGTTSNVANPYKEYTRPGSYTVFLKLNNTDSTTMPAFIRVGQTPIRDSLNLRIAYKDTSELGPYYYLIGALHNNNHPFPYTYQWDSSDGNIVGETQQIFTHQFSDAGIYSVRLIMTDQVGCLDTFYRNLDVTNEIIVPNVFTPNDDGINDRLVVRSNGRYLLSLKIYTRTGINIYKAEANTMVWDGRLPSGEKVLPGIYYYILETLDANPPVNKKGFFYIYP